MDFVISRALPPLAPSAAFDVRGEDIVPAVLGHSRRTTLKPTFLAERGAGFAHQLGAAVLGRVMFFCRIAVFAAENGSCPEYSLLSRSTCSSAEICREEPSQKVVRPPEMSLLP